MTLARTLPLPLALRLLRKLPLPRKLGLLEALFGQALSRAGVGWVRCANGVDWKLDLVDPTHRWIVFGAYEGGLGIEFARSRLKDGGVYVDSGANIGQWLLYLGALPGVRTLAFEPVDSQRHWLEACVARQSHWSSPCEILPFGLGAADQEVEIQCDGARSTTQLSWYQGKQLQRQTITIRRLDEVLQSAGIHQVEIWKLDVEGAEDAALLGAEHYLAHQRIRAIYFEARPANYGRCKDLLEGWGYRIHRLGRHGPQPISLDRLEAMEDLLALPIDAPSSLDATL